MSLLLCPRRCGVTLVLPTAFGISLDFWIWAQGELQTGSGEPQPPLRLSSPIQTGYGNKRLGAMQHPWMGIPGTQNLGSVCATLAREGTEGMDLPYLLITHSSHTSWSRTTFVISPRCCSSTCETTLKAAMAKPDREGRD